MGKSNRYVPYDIARQIVRDAGIPSRDRYWKWYEETMPLYLPKMPHRVYSEWDSWNEFLGTTNSFEKTRLRRIKETREYRSYWDAVRYAQVQAAEYKIKNRREWEEFYDEYELPLDIPKRPYHIYKGFSWDVWLGKDVMGRVESAGSVVGVMGLFVVEGQPDNVIVMKVYKDGYGALQKDLVDSVMLRRLIKVYQIEELEDVKVFRGIGMEFGSEQFDGTYIVGNMHQMLYEMDSRLLIYQPPKGVIRGQEVSRGY